MMKKTALMLLLAASGTWSWGQSQTHDQHTLVAAASEAVPEFTLEQLTSLVLTHNHLLLSARSSVEGALAGVQTASAIGNPKVEWHQGQWQPSALSRQQMRGWTVSQPIENPWVRRSRLEAAQAGWQLSGQQLAVARNDMAAQVRTKAYEALLYQSEAEAAGETLVLLEQVRERIRVRVETGEAPRYEMIKADAEVIHARERQQTASLQAEQAWLDINRMAAGKLPARWKLAVNFHDGSDVPDLAKLQAHAVQHNPELIGLKHELERAQAQWRAAQAARWPGLEVRYSDNREPEVRQNIWGVVVQVPLLDQRKGPIAEAQAEIDRIRARLEGRQTELQQQLLLAWRSLEMARLRVDALSQGVLKEAEAALRVAQAAYRFGERGILDVLDAQRVLRGVRADLLQARYQLHAARIALDQLSGRFAHAS
jgi:cobalt-zinc-cadmium efflux system outer membrane protein